MSIAGMPQLKRRLRAIGDTSQFLKGVQIAGIAEAKRRVPRKTGNLGRSIVAGPVTDITATVEARANYARFVEEGTGLFGPHKKKIVPKNAKVLHWKGGGSGKVRLSGRSRTRGGKAIADGIFAMSVKGRRATPFLFPGVKAAADRAGVDVIVDQWNEAA